MGFSSVFDLGHMLYKTGSCSVFSYAKLAGGYGNHCGIGGSGPIIDDIDSCCYLHDMCWTDIDSSWQLLVSYAWSCHGNGPTHIVCNNCLPDFKSERNRIKCEICKCDSRFAICLKNAITQGTPCPSLFG